MSTADVAAAIHAQVCGLETEPATPTEAEQADLTALYEPGAYAPLWIDGAGVAGRDACEAVALLEAAADEGLDPDDYRGGDLDRLAKTLEAPGPLPRSLARFDVAMSAAVLRYLRHLRLGRIDPRALGLRLSVPADGHDFPVMLRGALADHRLAGMAAELRPAIPQYEALRGMLSRYRSLATGAALEPLPALAKSVRPGEPYAGLDVLSRRLVAFGDLPRDAAPAAGDLYEGAIVEGVKRFQGRHGLEPDGVLGKRTQAELSVPVAWRVRQIELALERLRWLPDPGGERFVAINIPMFRLSAWDASAAGGAPALSMDVIVGRALKTQTPVFVEEMRDVIFRPYWNVPLSIARKEILPIVERDPDYLRRQDLEIVRGPGDDARAVEATAENLALVRQGALRLRQRPGPRNSLGLIKFDFPNEENVYMHGTPAQELFNRSRRDFSHGCVRVEDPVALAVWALGDRPEWTRERVLAAMTDTKSLRVPLTRPVRVVLFYTTAVVAPATGAIQFAEDIYRHDARLDQALRAAVRPRSTCTDQRPGSRPPHSAAPAPISGS